MTFRLDPVALTGRPAPSAGTTPPPREARPREARLLEAVQQLEGVFVQQLYKAMRESVPQDGGIVSGGTGEEMFTALMDQHLAAETPSHWERGLSDALYRQLSRHLAPAAPTPPDAAAAASLPDFVRQPDS